MLSGPERTCPFPVRPPGWRLPIWAQSPPPSPQWAFFWDWAKIHTDKPSHKNTYPPQQHSHPPKDIQNSIHVHATQLKTQKQTHTQLSVHGRVYKLTNMCSTSCDTVTNTHGTRHTYAVTKHSHEHMCGIPMQDQAPSPGAQMCTAGCRGLSCKKLRSGSPCQTWVPAAQGGRSSDKVGQGCRATGEEEVQAGSGVG